MPTAKVVLKVLQVSVLEPSRIFETEAEQSIDDVLNRLKLRPGCFDALFFNQKGELTEGARSNVFLVKYGIWFTPPLESGLLDGIMRQEILRSRRVCEQKLYHDDLLSAEAVYLSNCIDRSSGNTPTA
jgi:para-aminobenzoate synthetase/4-amino-4-deoxychorismate lyase